MHRENITRDEAAHRSGQVDDVRYTLSVELDPGQATFPSRTEVSFVAPAGSSTWLDLIAEQVSSITLNGQQLDVEAHYDGARVSLPDLQADNVVVVEAQCAYMSSGEGLHRFTDPVDERTYLYTQFEVADCRRVMAVFEQPDIKAPMALTVTAPAHWQVLSNRATPEASHLGDGRARWSFEPTWPLPSYLYAIVAGDYYAVHDSVSGVDKEIPLGLYCRQSLAESLDPEEIFTITKQGFGFFEEAFDYPYPFDKYDQVFAPEFNAGAMENPGVVTFHEDHYLFRSRVTEAAYENRAETILHEMAHMWFGNLVTMRWWDDLWLNESFAEWAAHHAASRATRFPHAWASFANARKAWAYRADQLPSTHPVAADMVDLETVYGNFDGITYAKGASALKQLVAYVGEDAFLAGLRHYFRTHAFGNTEFADLLAALSAASGQDLDEWAATWLQTSGVTLLRPEVTLDDDGRYREVAIVQEPPLYPEGLDPVLRPHLLALGLYDRTERGMELRDRVEVRLEGSRSEVEELRGVTPPDLLLVNDGDLTYAKIRLDPGSMGGAVDGLAELADPLARALIWASAWDMTRDAELPTAEFVALVAGGIGVETDVALVGQVLRQCLAAVSQFADPGQRDFYCDTLASALRDATTAAPPASDHQLAFLRGFISFAGPDDIPTMRALLDGDEVFPGLSVDTDLRWNLVTRLVSMGAAGEESILTQLEADSTAAGQRWAITARGSAPELGAKQRAWESALHDAALHNAALEATIMGIMQPFQGDLVRPFIDQYFAALPEVSETRTHEISQTITGGLFPTLVPETSTVERTTEFLDSHPELADGVRRQLLEGRDGLLRSLRCIARDRSG